jgi:outer membrane lipoprotein carrier protein
VENKYNKAKTLQVLYREDYTPQGRPKRTESGVLQLRKPGKMRWEYSQPQGKLLISDGKYMWLYTPADNKVEKMSLKESDDMRAPLAFLLGKLNFDKEFRNIRATPEEGGTRIVAEPKTDSLPYSSVEFLVTPDFSIKQLKVKYFDGSMLDFAFDQERVDPPLEAKLFQFKPAQGVEVVEDVQ